MPAIPKWGSTSSTGSHTHVECSNKECNEWLVSKVFNLSNFSNIEIGKLDIYCYRCLSIRNVKKDIEICKLQIELSEVQEKLNARMNDSERIVMLEHEVLKLGELMQGRDAGFVNQKQKGNRCMSMAQSQNGQI